MFIMQFLLLLLDMPLKSADYVIILLHTEFSHSRVLPWDLTFNGSRVSAAPFYAKLSVLKFFDQVEIMNISQIPQWQPANWYTQNFEV